MKKIAILIALTFAVVASALHAQQREVILSMNELYRWGYDTPLSPKWQRAVELCGERKMSLGVMGDSLIDDNPAFYKWVKEAAATGSKDFFSMGYRQKRECPNRKDMLPIEALQNEKRQTDALDICQQLAAWNLGFKFSTFCDREGCNGDTAKALEANGFKNWVIRGVAPQGAKEFKGKTLILDSKNCPALGEGSSVKFDTFKANLAKMPAGGLAILIVTPEKWEDADFAEFAKILESLKDAKFTTFADYFAK